MIFINKFNPLYFDTSINFGHFHQEICSKTSPYNIAARVAIGVCTKAVARVADVALHVIFGSIKLMASAVEANYSIFAAAFNYTSTHHRTAKQASRHLCLGAFYAADIFLSLTNIINKYPQHLIDKLQKHLAVENINEEIDVEFEQTYQVGKEMSIRPTSQKIQELQERLNRATGKIQKLQEENKALSDVCALQEQLLNRALSKSGNKKALV